MDLLRTDRGLTNLLEFFEEIYDHDKAMCHVGIC